MAATGALAGVPSRHLSTFLSRSSTPCHASVNFDVESCVSGSVASSWVLGEVRVAPRSVSWVRSVRSIQYLCSSGATMIDSAPITSAGPIVSEGRAS